MAKNLATTENMPRQELSAASSPATPATLLSIAVQQGADLAKLEKLMDLQEKWEANEARKAFVEAMNAFKADPPVVYKSKTVEYATSHGTTRYNHALLEEAVESIGAALTRHGLSFRWDCVQLEGGQIEVSCVVTHVKGHSERVSLRAGADQSGGKNNIQALGSTVTYLQRYTLFAATGMAAKDADDDGEANSERQPEAPRVTVSDEDQNTVHDQTLLYLEEGNAAAMKKLWAKHGPDEQAMLWRMFNSAQRSAIKKLIKGA